MTDITELIRADHERIGRLFAAFDDAVRFTRLPGDPGSCPAWTLGAIWSRIEGLLDVHAEAEYEICCCAMFASGTDQAGELDGAIADLDDIRHAVAEARNQGAGSRPWWLAVNAARRASNDHVRVIEGALTGFRERTCLQFRDDLGQQWAAFLAARRCGATAPG
jgi:hypothetical protein